MPLPTEFSRRTFLTAIAAFVAGGCRWPTPPTLAIDWASGRDFTAVRFVNQRAELWYEMREAMKRGDIRFQTTEELVAWTEL